MSAVKRHVIEPRTDARGWVVDPLAAAGGGRPGHLHLASLAPGAVRGNHVHPERAEFIAVWGGPAEVAWDEGGTVVRERLDGRVPWCSRCRPASRTR